MMPWFGKLVEEDLALLGDDWWPYGIEANRNAVDTFLRYHFETGPLEAPANLRRDILPELLET